MPFGTRQDGFDGSERSGSDAYVAASGSTIDGGSRRSEGSSGASGARADEDASGKAAADSEADGTGDDGVTATADRVAVAVAVVVAIAVVVAVVLDAGSAHPTDKRIAAAENRNPLLGIGDIT
jgi:hypothetical protein